MMTFGVMRRTAGGSGGFVFGLALLLALAACSNGAPNDWDLRTNDGGTAQAVVGLAGAKPTPDANAPDAMA